MTKGFGVRMLQSWKGRMPMLCLMRHLLLCLTKRLGQKLRVHPWLQSMHPILSSLSPFRSPIISRQPQIFHMLQNKTPYPKEPTGLLVTAPADLELTTPTRKELLRPDTPAANLVTQI